MARTSPVSGNELRRVLTNRKCAVTVSRSETSVFITKVEAEHLRKTADGDISWIINTDENIVYLEMYSLSHFGCTGDMGE